jgi:hypothetical protein
MAHIVEIHNPFKPLEDTRRHEHPGGVTVRAWLEATYPGFREFTHPTICLVNGEPLLRAQWGAYVVLPADVVNFVVLPGDPVTLFWVFVAVVVVSAVVIVATMPKPRTPSELPEADPVYNLKGQRNQVRLGNPIEVPYGRCRLFPSYAARSYNKYIGNEQYQYQLFCLGQGYYEVEELRIEDTPIDNFQDIEYAFYEPGQPAVLFPDNVVTSDEVSGIEMPGTNEPEYEGFIGGFVLNPAFTLANTLEVDLVMPQGLYRMNDDGTLASKTVTAVFEYRPVDGAGAPTGDWATLIEFRRTMSTSTPQRLTLSAPVAPGRYEIRGRRSNAKDTSTRAAHTLVWDAARAFLPSTKNYGDVTILAVVARATNNLNDRASNRINCFATRKLRTWDKVAQEWTARVATRSICWAAVDLFQSAYGGKLTDDTKLELDSLADLDAIYASQGRYFDFVFDQKTTVWEAARTIGRVGRALPMLNGTRISLLRDSAKNLPTAVFSQENILKNSFQLQIKLPNVDEHDSVEVEYVDPATWKQEVVLCTLEGGTTNNPEKVQLLGCTSRDWAYREGLYIRAQRRYLRENVTFRTGMEGHIPSYGDLIAVSHDLPRWGSAGLLEAIDGNTLALSEPVTFTTGTHYIVLRKKNGDVAGPFIVTAGADAFHVVAATSVGSDYFFDDEHERPMFLFGAGTWGKLMTVVGLDPIDDEAVEVQAVNYDARLFSFDGLTAPPLYSPALPPGIPALPAVTGLEVESMPDTVQQVLASWAPALGAQYYLVQTSSNGTDWTILGTTTATSQIIAVEGAHLWVRVAGVNLGAGPWATWDGGVGEATTIPGNVTGLQLQAPFTGTFAKIQWVSQALASSYEVKVYQDGGATLMRTVSTYDPTYTYVNENAEEDGTIKRDLRFTVRAQNSLGYSETAAVLDVSNPVPAAPSSPASSVSADEPTRMRYQLSWDPVPDVDVRFYRLWGSAVSGFTPGPGNLILEALVDGAIVEVPKVSGSHPPYYWRVAAVDVWGEEANPTAEQTILFANQLTDGSGNLLTDGSGNLLRG